LVAASGLRRSGARQEWRAKACATDARGADRALLRDDASWLLDAAAGRPEAAGQAARGQGLSEAATLVLDALAKRGASFLADLVRETRQLTSVVEDALWELAAAGLVTADGFENLRALIDPKRRLATARHHSRRARFVPGRWALLRPSEASWGQTPVQYGGLTPVLSTQLRPEVPRRLHDNCCCDGAWCSATCWRVKRSRRPGGIC